MGLIRESRHFLRKVGIMSSVQEASGEFNIAIRTSASVAGVKQVSEGGKNRGGWEDGIREVGNTAESFKTSSVKKERKEQARSRGEV